MHLLISASLNLTTCPGLHLTSGKDSIVYSFAFLMPHPSDEFSNKEEHDQKPELLQIYIVLNRLGSII